MVTYPELIQATVPADGTTDLLAIWQTGRLRKLTIDELMTSSASNYAFPTIQVATQNDVVADSSTDILTLAAGAGMTITTDDTTDTITFTSSASAQNLFDSVAVSGETTVTADTPTTQLELVAGTNITMTTDNTLKQVTINAAGGGGTVQSASNVGVGGVGVFKQLNGTDLEFKNINVGSNQLSVTDDVGNDEVDLDLVPGNVLTSTLNNDANFAADQNLWETITATTGPSFSATTTTDTLNFAAGTNMTITSDGTDTLTFDAASAMSVVGNVQFTTEIFTDPADFTAGVSNSITLVASPTSEDQLLIFFEGVEQHTTEFSLAGSVVTFTSVIPVGVTQIEVRILEGGGIFTESFTSADQAITSAGGLTLAHGLSTTPILIQCQIINTIADKGFSPGDVVQVGYDQESTTNRGVAVWADSTNINVRYGSSAQVFSLVDATTGVRSGAQNLSWDFRITAWA